MTTPAPLWRHCVPCETKWKGADPCFSCGAEVESVAGSAPYITAYMTWLAGYANGPRPC